MEIDEYRFCVIGPGRLGTTLIAALTEAGLTVSAVGVHEDEQAVLGAGGGPLRCGSATRPPRPTPGGWPSRTTTSSRWPASSRRPCPTRAAVARSPLAIHSSGLGSLKLLRPLDEAGAMTFCLHPLQTFTGEPRADVDEGRTLRGDGPGRERGGARRQAGRTPRHEPFRLADEGKPLYHLAAAVASNLLVALESEAARLMNEATGARTASVCSRRSSRRRPATSRHAAPAAR